MVASDNTILAESFDRFQTWINLYNNYYSCRRWPRFNNISRSIPSRLLDINLASNLPRIRLVICDEVAEDEPRYAILSYYWGGNFSFRFLQNNMEEMKSGIIFGALPKTFQEAIFVARKLKILYL